jgi:hypothetical protein
MLLSMKAAIPGSTVPETGTTYIFRSGTCALLSLSIVKNKRKNLRRRMMMIIRAGTDTVFNWRLVI